MQSKVCILPCNGVGQVTSTTTREAGWEIQAMRPECAILINSSAVAVNHKESIAALKSNPVIAIDGCSEKCATRMLEAKGINAALIIDLIKVCVKKKISLAGETRAKTGPGHKRLAKAIAEIAIAKIDSLTNNKCNPGLQKGVTYAK